MRKSIDTYIKAIAHDNEQEIRENYMTIADYIINDAENCTGYYEYFDDEELDETGEPSEAQIEELKAYLRENYTTPIEHRIEDIMLTKHSNGSDNLQYKATVRCLRLMASLMLIRKTACTIRTFLRTATSWRL